MPKMRLFFLLVTMTVLTSCAALLDKYSVVVNYTDFSKYADDGLFITTGDSPEKYTSIAIVRVVCMDGYIIENNKETEILNDSYYQKKTTSFKHCEQDEMIDLLVQDCLKRGANGVIKLTFENELIPVSSGRNRRVSVVSGLAVKF